MSVEDWSTTADNNNSASPNGAPEGMLPSGVNNTIRQVMADVRADLMTVAETQAALKGWTVKGGYAMVLGASTSQDQQPTLYKWNSTSSATDNATTILIPDDQGQDDNGRWVASTGISNQHTISASAVAVGAGGINSTGNIVAGTISASAAYIGSGNIILRGDLFNDDTTGGTVISGGSDATSGGNIFMYGESHPSNAKAIAFRKDETVVGQYVGTSDHWEFRPNGGSGLYLTVSGMAVSVLTTISANAATTQTVLTVEADSITTGNAAKFTSVSTDSSGRAIVDITNNSSAATGCTLIDLQQDAPKAYIDFVGNEEAYNSPGGNGPIITTAGATATKYGALKVEVNGTIKFIRLYNEAN